MNTRAFVENVFRAIWVTADLEALPGFFAKEAQVKGIAPELELTPEDMVTLVNSVRMHLSDLQVEVVTVLEVDDWISALVVCHGSAKANGEPVEISGQTMMRICNGRVAEAYNHYDALGFFSQVGGLPSNALECLLGGATLTHPTNDKHCATNKADTVRTESA
ncbi:ester cyclase [Palleronia abyssalis]|uniref:SnoaL-like domain-containing protein n=1 Tax=Palleronia abyssalis TaxID=1501240 RepID=A0A2R8C0K1_9RHOB|nr:ester cyclase [Palleronia abyssalis]SPJ25928.1 hypothetical protein PAA8504_03780 [Palleronia abyssalis]